MAIFTRRINKNKEGTEWGIYFTLTDITSVTFATIGGYLVASAGFPTLIITLVVISIFGVGMLRAIKPYIKLK